MIGEINLTPTASFSQYSLSTGDLQIRTWGNISDCKGIVILVHGLGAHAGWFEAMGRQLKVRRLYSLAYDQKGFGQRRDEQLTSYKEWVNELCVLFDLVKATSGGRPIYLLGNSMGALVALAASAHIKPDGLIIASPGLDGHPALFTWQYKIVSLFKAFVHPHREVSLPYTCDLSTRDEALRNWLAQDPYQRRAVPGSMLYELLQLSYLINNGCKSVSMPILMLTAGVEKIVDNRCNARFFKKLKAPFKASRCFNEAWHDLMFDPLIDEVADSIASWQSDLMLEAVLSS